MSKRIDGHKHAQWRERITRFTQTSLTVSEFCRSEGVPDGSFYYWRRKLAELPAEQSDSFAPAIGRFLPVQVTPAADATEIEFAFPNGASMRLPSADRKLLQWAIESVAKASFEQGED
jgi:transposase-like protein